MADRRRRPAKSKKLTPMMRQYTRIKAEFPDTILFFRMGDFYEMFGDDAKVASDVLGIALTSREKGEKAVPMAGVPYHAADSYLARLIKAGLNVAVCDQTEDPAKAKGIVKREVVRVITPGTVYEENIVPADSNVYLASVCRAGEWLGVAYADVSTGEFAVDRIPHDRLLAELNRLTPREILFHREQNEVEKALHKEFASVDSVSLVPLDAADFDPSVLAAELAKLFDTEADTLEGKAWLGAACGLYAYLNRTQRGNLGQFRSIRDNALSETLAIDSRSLRNLEILSSISGGRKLSLRGVCDYTSTAMGSRMLRQWLAGPLTDIEHIRFRQQAVESFSDDTKLRSALIAEIKGMCDVERVTARAAAARANPRDLAALRTSLEKVKVLSGLLEAAPYPLDEFGSRLDHMPQLLAVLNETIVDDPPVHVGDGQLVRDGVNEELDKLRDIMSGGKTWIAQYQRTEGKRAGIPKLKVGYNSVFGYYIEVTKTHVDKVPEDYIRKQTLVNAERYITPELKEYENRVLSAREQIEQIESTIFRETRDKVARETSALYRLAELLASLDVLAGFSRLAEEKSFCIPEVHDGIETELIDCRHPVVEDNLPSGEFVPNDTRMDREKLIHIITGPNMSGKSTYIRQVAQAVILAQAGAPVPAAKASVGLVNRLLTRIGAGDDLARGRSTFMVEMLETAEILASATPRSLIILDEVGRGTSTFDGLSLAWAITEYIHDTRTCNARTLFATHYHELTELASVKDSVQNYKVLVREWEDEIVFLHRIEPGFSDRSYGIHVGRLANLPDEVIKRADKILRSLEKQSLDIEGKPRNVQMRKGHKQKEVQLLLFESPHEHILDKIRDCEPEKLTPLEALEYITRLKRELEE
ncbi:MAG: DNA mismatch repair protein MutS [Planctomycetota bacterium]|nr:DNA mismatch repair protein MutS [Planctomycetota bacterium]